MKDVAAKAGVSTATVSRVLNKPGDVADKTRWKVECAIFDLKYQPVVFTFKQITARRYHPAGTGSPLFRTAASGC
ncbi:MAG: LacI family DNA-binding transcriptional regulator [Clostridiales bacterium]|nr:LacI family DNA-binding transcriptional regulator [Clostridiales bacterium]